MRIPGRSSSVQQRGSVIPSPFLLLEANLYTPLSVRKFSPALLKVRKCISCTSEFLILANCFSLKFLILLFTSLIPRHRPTSYGLKCTSSTSFLLSLLRTVGLFRSKGCIRELYFGWEYLSHPDLSKSCLKELSGVHILDS